MEEKQMHTAVAGKLLENGIDGSKIFDSAQKADALFLYVIDLCAARGNGSQGVYLTTLSDVTNLTIPQVSDIVKRLQAQGYVEWNMNETKDHTYVELTEKAVRHMHDEQSRMETCYQAIRQEIPEEELETTLKTMKKIRRIFQSTL